MRETDRVQKILLFYKTTEKEKEERMMEIDKSNLCSHLQKKLFATDGVYYPLWQSVQKEEEERGDVSVVVRSRQLHVYRNGKKIMILAGKAQPKILREDSLCDLLRSILQ